MADQVIHFIETLGQDGDGPLYADKTPCGVPAPRGQLFHDGEPLGATTLPHSVTCVGCSIRARAAMQEYAARDAAEQQKVNEAVEADKLKAAMAIVEAAKAKGNVP